LQSGIPRIAADPGRDVTATSQASSSEAASTPVQLWLK
jgi:hypothetical protein